MIEEKAVELGRVIGQTDEYKSVRQARESLEEITEIRAQTQRLQALAEKIEEHARMQQEYEGLMSSIQAHPKYQQLIAAQANFDKIMLRVNESILEGMKKGAESSIIIPG